MPIQHWLRGGLTALLLSVTVASCDHAERNGAEQLTAPQELLLSSPSKVVTAEDADGNIESYTLVEEDGLLSSLTTLHVSELIGIDGGELTLLGHTLTVPAGAVDEPALFTLTVLADGYVHVDLMAVRLSLLGLIDIGAQGFDEPVEVTMTYERATNVPRRKQNDLVILRLNPDGFDAVHEVMPAQVDKKSKTVTTWLDHFSGYCMAM